MKKSPRRGYANRRNGLLSCGPSSEEGKAKSSRNALKHGLTARHLLLQGENPLEYRNHVQALHDDFSPKGALENGLVGRIADLSWRLRRVPRFEAALLTSIRDEDLSMPDLTGGEKTEKTQLGSDLQKFFNMDFGDKLIKHENSLHRQLVSTLQELHLIQAQRQKAEQSKAAAQIPLH